MKLIETQFPPITVYGEAISRSQQVVAFEALGLEFGLYDLIGQLRRVGVKDYTGRAADRVLQKLRKASIISYDTKRGRWIKLASHGRHPSPNEGEAR